MRYQLSKKKFTLKKIDLLTKMVKSIFFSAPEEAMQLRGLIKSSNESLGLYLFGKIEFWNF